MKGLKCPLPCTAYIYMYVCMHVCVIHVLTVWLHTDQGSDWLFVHRAASVVPQVLTPHRAGDTGPTVPVGGGVRTTGGTLHDELGAYRKRLVHQHSLLPDSQRGRLLLQMQTHLAGEREGLKVYTTLGCKQVALSFPAVRMGASGSEKSRAEEIFSTFWGVFSFQISRNAVFAQKALTTRMRR